MINIFFQVQVQYQPSMVVGLCCPVARVGRCAAAVVADSRVPASRVPEGLLPVAAMHHALLLTSSGPGSTQACPHMWQAVAINALAQLLADCLLLVCHALLGLATCQAVPSIPFSLLSQYRLGVVCMQHSL
jgi:hypothetical protein